MNKLAIKDFDYEERKKQVPEGCIPIESLPIPCSIRHIPEIMKKGFKTESQALKWCQKYHNKMPNLTFQIEKIIESILEVSYQVIIPLALIHLLDCDDQDTVTTVIKDNKYRSGGTPDILYREIGYEYIDDFFKNGDILLSTFSRCKTLENEQRRDKYEIQNVIEIIEGSLRVETQIAFNVDSLLLCTSSIFPNGKNPSDFIKIVDVAGFTSAFAKKLVQANINLVEVLQGFCVYNDKKLSYISNDNFIHDLIKKSKKNKYPFSTIGNYILAKLEDDIYMNKPTYFDHENEYRFVFKLYTPIYIYDSNIITMLDNGSMIIHAPELIQYCEKC